SEDRQQDQRQKHRDERERPHDRFAIPHGLADDLRFLIQAGHFLPFKFSSRKRSDSCIVFAAVLPSQPWPSPLTVIISHFTPASCIFFISRSECKIGTTKS